MLQVAELTIGVELEGICRILLGESDSGWKQLGGG